MDKLELKHLAPYLPYGLKFHHFDEERIIHSICEFSQITPDEIVIINNMHEYAYEIGSHHVKPILRPLSDYTDINSPAICDLGIDLCDEMSICDLANGIILSNHVPYQTIVIMQEEHIDFQNLIPAGLAISYKEAGL